MTLKEFVLALVWGLVMGASVIVVSSWLDHRPNWLTAILLGSFWFVRDIRSAISRRKSAN